MELAGSDWERKIDDAMQADRFRLRRQWIDLVRASREGRPLDKRFERWRQDLEQSLQRRAARAANRPKLTYDESLPVSARREEIAEAIEQNQVIVVCGETGSGKSTQLPKICLEVGRGIDGMIGHTQPRRIAARSLAARIASELGSPVGGLVGYKVRFADATRPETLVKLMTDGILLAETQGDRFLDQYDTLIIDEAHERSLNIDFLIGFLTRLLPRRPDLKVIITSATIDAERFAEHFATHRVSVAGTRELRRAPLVEVTGRTYPVEVRYRPPGGDAEGEQDLDLPDLVVRALDEFRGEPLGDVLVFLPTERDIHETMNVLRGSPAARDGRTELLPLYARLSAKEQQRVFEAHAGRRIVLATNVAESSLTVPGVRYVVDTGLARISRYSPRSKVQRLPIEAVSQASCDQRAGRCGRVAPGICVRLYSEEDYQARDRFTPPEIVRTNLAAVILQTKALKLGAIESFPFLEPPRHEMIRDGYQTLFELGALDDRQELTEVGRQLARLPLDPRVARMLLAARDEGCLRELLIIAAALEVQDPRERPADKRQAADEKHQQFADPRSDFLAYLKLWDFYHRLKQQLTRGQLRKACLTNFLSYNRMREWSDVHRQLVQLLADTWGALAELRPAAGLAAAAESEAHEGPGGAAEPGADGGANADAPRRAEAAFGAGEQGGAPSPGAADAARHGRRRAEDREEERRYGAIHRAILTGLLSGIAMRKDGAEYQGAGQHSLFLWPGSGAFAVKPQWVVAAELVETTRRYARTVAQIDPRWIEPLALHLVKRAHGDPHWNGKSGTATTNERISLFGLPIGKRRVPLAPIDPLTTREMFLRHGLAEGDLELRAPFFRHNQELRERLAAQAAKTRRADLVVEPQTVVDFYQARLPAEVVDAPSLNRWRQQVERSEPRRLFMTEEDLVGGEPTADVDRGFPDEFPLHDVRLPLQYRFEPGVDDDGITLVVPKAALHQITPERLGWLVPGLLEQKIEQLVRSLPKSWRRELPPAEEAAKKAVALLRFGQGAFLDSVARALSQVIGKPIPVAAFQPEKLPHYLHMNVRVTADDGRELASGRELDELQARLGVRREPTRELAEARWRRDGIRKWDFGDLPDRVPVVRGGVELAGFPTLVDRGDSVSLRLLDGQYEAETTLKRGVRRLAALAAGALLREHVEWLPNYKRIALLLAPVVKPDKLKDQLVDLLAERAFVGDGPAPRTEAEFTARLVNPRRRCEGPVVEVSRFLGPLAEAFHEVRLSLETARPAHFQASVDDVRRQLGRLLGEDFLIATPWEWLQHVPRYVKALKMRLERLTSNGPRDAASTAELATLEKAWREQDETNRKLGRHDAELDRYRWWLEEYRVSLFAQALGTSIPISPQRLAKQWALVQK